MTDDHESASDRLHPREGNVPGGDGRGASAPEPDPTGIREILAHLPDPGPMPADLVARITASLAAEQTVMDRHRSWHGGRNGAGDPGPVRFLDAERGRRPGSGGRTPMIALAASIAVLAGAAILGLLTLTGGPFTTGGADSAALDATAQHSARDDAGAGDSQDEAGGADATEEGQAFGSTELAPGDGADGDTPILATGAVLTSATLVDHARALRDGALGPAPDGEAERSRSSSPVGTSTGAAACLGALLGISPEIATGLLDAVDFVRFDGAPAALLVTDEAGSAQEAAVGTAYLVPLDCGPEAAVPLHAAVRLDS